MGSDLCLNTLLFVSHFEFCRYKAKKKAFVKYAKRVEGGNFKAELERLKKYATSIRVLAHTQPKKAPGIKQKKAHLVEIQVSKSNH